MKDLNTPIWKQALPHLLAVLFFIAITLIYFKPMLNGKSLQQGDMTQWRGMAQELVEFNDSNPDELGAWSGSMFSGMPSYHFMVAGDNPSAMTYVNDSLSLLDSNITGPVFAGLICAYILFFLITGNIWLSLLGALAFAFSSYNIIIIQAGHVTKAWAIAYMPLVLSGLLLILKKKYLVGGALFALALGLELVAMHVQITYYLAIFCLVLYIAYVVNCIRKKEYTTLGKGTLTLLLAVILAILPSIGRLYADYDMAKASTRGASELVTDANSTTSSDGLDIDYAFQWSYGKGETLSLLIPDIRGGASGAELKKGSELYKNFREYSRQTGQAMETHWNPYWGDQPFTSGPVYFGAIICFLFILGMFTIKSNLKWWLLGASILFIILAWGRNSMSINEFFFNHLPMYNKFRTPSMALVIPGLIFPILAVWGAKEIIQGKVKADKLKKYLLLSAGITGIICLVLWLIPDSFCGFLSAQELNMADKLPNWYIDALVADRADLLKSDALRSLVFILLAGASIYLFMNKNKTVLRVSLIGLVALVFIDLWVVDKRYLNDSSFSKKKTEKTFVPTSADISILEDKSPSYRVLNLSVGNPFSDSSTSYFHKSVGGYHAAKLGRYQELIDHRMMKELNLFTQELSTVNTNEALFDLLSKMPTLNMLNTKYIILDPNAQPLINPMAYGNAWFVDEVKIVNSANEELDALNSIDPSMSAVVDVRFKDQIKTKNFIPGENDSIELLEYKPNYLKYSTTSMADQLAVFSEVYFENGWKAFIDGKPSEHFRANWVLRAMNVPAGQHTIEFRFEPDTYKSLSLTGSIMSFILLIGFFAVLGYTIWRNTKKES